MASPEAPPGRDDVVDRYLSPLDFLEFPASFNANSSTSGHVQETSLDL